MRKSLTCVVLGSTVLMDASALHAQEEVKIPAEPAGSQMIGYCSKVFEVQ